MVIRRKRLYPRKRQEHRHLRKRADERVECKYIGSMCPSKVRVQSYFSRSMGGPYSFVFYIHSNPYSIFSSQSNLYPNRMLKSSDTNVAYPYKPTQKLIFR